MSNKIPSFKSKNLEIQYYYRSKVAPCFACFFKTKGAGYKSALASDYIIQN